MIERPLEKDIVIEPDLSWEREYLFEKLDSFEGRISALFLRHSSPESFLIKKCRRNSLNI